ncbi:hypothetical protein DIPPA_33713 [Diplonema papillatum]|nr:hypothetical protein DIPPA_33713 [Diplonema papillatum]
MDSVGPLKGEGVQIVSHENAEDANGREFVVYVIRVNWGAGRPWKVKKRYTEFEGLHKRLVQTYGKEQVPKLTRRKLPVGGSKQFLDYRTNRLQTYLRDIIDNWRAWFYMGDKPSGPGTMLEINEFIFDFLDFASNAIIRPPEHAAIEGAGVFFGSPVIKNDSRPVIRPMINGVELKRLVELLKSFDIAEDDAKVDGLGKALSELEAAGKPCFLNVLQTKTLLEHAFFSEVRVLMIELLVPLVQDPDNYRNLHSVIDFDADMDKVAQLFQEQSRKRQRETDIVSVDKPGPATLNPRRRGITITPD